MANFPGPQPILQLPGQGPVIQVQGVQGVNTIYVNGIAILYSAWDFSLVFLRGLPAESGAGAGGGEHSFETTAQAVSSVVMSPQHAKAMLKALADNIQAYEKEHGEIPVVKPAPGSAAPPSSPPTDSPTGGKDDA
jgi:Protein of unknown function (DUF3467)